MIKNHKSVIINTILNDAMTEAEVEVSLSDEQRLVFMEAIEESLRLTQRTHLFNWLQRGIQYLIGHEVMIFGVRSSDSDLYDYEYFTSSRYFGPTQFADVIKKDEGIVRRSLAMWNKIGMPIFVSNEVQSVKYPNYSVVNVDPSALYDSELKNFVVHGFGDTRTKISTVVVFGRLSCPVDASTAYMLELIMPHLHCALIKVTSNRSGAIMPLNATHISKKITRRESEILQWLHLGKTNWEISSILEISPLTVKNHVQNILRKLDVENRGQAALKANKLGLVNKTTS
ncbi:MAG: LuxR C-terminal-related transcriptional regulator [Methylophilus sp.]|nr:LuxR C-terminal-related transcriptional regulator [Methylophilus sp.]